jgi:hypothetical protein
VPVNWRNYPPNWKLFAAGIREVRAHNQCECTGECGIHRGRRCIEVHGRHAVYARGKITLTTAHLCRCAPLCALPEHVKSMCQRCHLRVDIHLHLRNRALKRLQSQPVLNYPPT